MFAIVKTGGKQYKVKEGSKITVEKLNAKVGDKVMLEKIASFNQVSYFNSKGSIQACVEKQYRGEKVIIFKKKRRKGYRRKNGHRQYLTDLKIIGIN